MGQKPPKTEVTFYRMSLHYGICHGPLDYIKEIKIKEKVAWSGKAINYTAIAINDIELFGGEKKEGGVQGTVHYLPGGDAQTIPEVLAARVGLTTATMPAYRGIASLWFVGINSGYSSEGFYWSANSPFIPGTWVKVARASLGLTNSIARIYRIGSTLVGTSVSLGGGRTGNRSFKWDTNGDWSVWGEDGSGTLVWDLPAGTTRTISASDGTSAHITDTGKLITCTSSAPSGLRIYTLATGALDQSIDLVAAPLFDSIGCDDITIGEDNYVIGVGDAGGDYFLLKSEGGADYELVWENATGEIAGFEVSIGSEYAYFMEGGIFDNCSRIIRVGFPTFSETAVTPTGLTAFIGACHFDENSGTVIIACTNGDLFKYSADLSTLLASKTGNGFTMGRDGLLCKRMSVAPGSIAFYVAVGGGIAGNIHIFSTSDLSLDRIFIGADAEEFTEPSPSFVGFNIDHGMAFFPSHGADSLLWFILGVGEFDSNPAHIIYECLTNTDWGMGSASTVIDVDSFEDAAQVLFDEQFGLSLQWTKQSTIESFVSEILDHIEATLFINPRTGLLTLKLIRDDYSITGLPEYTPDNSVVTKFGRKLWGETINEIIVSFTNPDNEESETVVAQDLANIVAQGSIVSDSRNYYGVRVKALAARLAQRDLRTAASPLATCDIEVNREGWDLLPGGVLVLNSPEDGINAMVMRVGSVDYGKPGDPTVRATLMEDVFSLAAAEYTIPPDTISDDDEEPAPAANTYIFTLAYFMVVNVIDAAILVGVEYPEVFAGVLASQAGSDSDEFELYGEIVNPGGGTTIGNLATMDIVVRATLPAAIDAEAQTNILSFPDRSVGEGPIVGGFMLIGEGDEDTIELCLILSFGIGGYTMRRGVLDTTPKAWPLGTPIWFFNSTQRFTDQTIRSEAEVVEYQILPRTPLGLLDLDDAPVVIETLTARPHLPLRPADVKVNGIGFGTSDCIGVDPIPVTWANRNRLTEDSQILAWDAATVIGEAGQATNVYATDLGGTILASHTGLSGTSYNLDPADFGAESEGYILVKSECDGLESLQGYRIRVVIFPQALFIFEDGEQYLFEDDEQKLFED